MPILDICNHGSIRRKCPICDLHNEEAENERLRARIAELEREREALISAGQAVRRCCLPLTEYWEHARPALDAITGQPDALEAWMERTP